MVLKAKLPLGFARAGTNGDGSEKIIKPARQQCLIVNIKVF
jgi:hypothetical protein